jgi:hypothetical protein
MNEQGRTQALHVPSGQKRVLSRKVSGGADDWRMFMTPDGSTFISSPTIFNSFPIYWLEALFEGKGTAEDGGSEGSPEDLDALLEDALRTPDAEEGAEISAAMPPDVAAPGSAPIPAMHAAAPGSAPILAMPAAAQPVVAVTSCAPILVAALPKVAGPSDAGLPMAELPSSAGPSAAVLPADTPPSAIEAKDEPATKKQKKAQEQSSAASGSTKANANMTKMFKKGGPPCE